MQKSTSKQQFDKSKGQCWIKWMVMFWLSDLNESGENKYKLWIGQNVYGEDEWIAFVLGLICF